MLQAPGIEGFPGLLDTARGQAEATDVGIEQISPFNGEKCHKRTGIGDSDQFCWEPRPPVLV